MTFRLVVHIAAAGILILFIRSYIFLQNSRQLFAQSNAFSTDYYLGNPTNPPLLYLVLGDSTAKGEGADSLETTLPYTVGLQLSKNHYVHLQNFSSSGAKINELIQNQIPKISSFHPDLLTIQIGANDATHLTATSDFQRSLNQLIRALSYHPNTAVFISNTPNLGVVPALFFPTNLLANHRAQQQNILLEKAQSGTHFQIIDLFTQGTLTSDNLYASDRFHPSSAGYAIWAKLFSNSIKKNGSW